MIEQVHDLQRKTINRLLPHTRQTSTTDAQDEMRIFVHRISWTLAAAPLEESNQSGTRSNAPMLNDATPGRYLSLRLYAILLPGVI